MPESVLATWPIEELLPPRGGAFVYRFYDAEGRLLYVGMTENLGARAATHSTKSWFDRVASYTARVYASRVDAAIAEAAAIRDERPVVNSRGKRETCDEKETRLRAEASGAETRLRRLQERLEVVRAEHDVATQRWNDMRGVVRMAEKSYRLAQRDLTLYIAERAKAEVLLAS